MSVISRSQNRRQAKIPDGRPRIGRHARLWLLVIGISIPLVMSVNTVQAPGTPAASGIVLTVLMLMYFRFNQSFIESRGFTFDRRMIQHLSVAARVLILAVICKIVFSSSFIVGKEAALAIRPLSVWIDLFTSLYITFACFLLSGIFAGHGFQHPPWQMGHALWRGAGLFMLGFIFFLVLSIVMFLSKAIEFGVLFSARDYDRYENALSNDMGSIGAAFFTMTFLIHGFALFTSAPCQPPIQPE